MRLLRASDSRSCAVVTLEQSYAQEPALSRVVATLALHLPLEGAPTVLRKLTHEEGVADSFALATASSDEAEARDIATAIRLLAAVHGVSRDDIAVVCRSASAARALAERLSRVGIDAEATLRATALREEPVIRDLFATSASSRFSAGRGAESTTAWCASCGAGPSRTVRTRAATPRSSRSSTMRKLRYRRQQVALSSQKAAENATFVR